MPFVGPDHSVFLGAAPGEGGPKSFRSILVIRTCQYPQRGLVPSRCLRHIPRTLSTPLSSLTTPGSPSPQTPLQPRPAGSPLGAAQPLSSPRPMSSSRRTAAAPPTQRSLPLDAAALLLHAAGTTFGAQPQLPPGFFPHPATPPFQFDRIGRDRRFGPDSAAEISPGRHFVSRDGSDGSGAARERGRSHEVTRRRRFPGVQGSQGSSRRRPQLGQATLTTGG
ncbi:hypothetical protein NDU88_006943 [Pleurodeles waltl]|uniref:Uncharacterized protein n=1 Tax=Pleurodeles waltl TaxID=8319 RepID=A0AAV7VNA2_PLEWA|nr:hypothetical protein NDU88_006943 [Pleurodeles waltl]